MTFPLKVVGVRRPCGGCTACCTAVGVKELAKPPGVRCRHELDGGCAVYGGHPQECRDYYCLWSLGLLEGGDELRPDRLGLVIDPREPAPGQSGVGVFEVRPGAASTPGAVELLTRLSRGALVILRLHGVERYRAWRDGREVLVRMGTVTF